jgi:hypothetical protein
MAETEPSHAPDTWLENRVVDALVRKYLRADMIHHLIKRIDNDPLLQPSYRMNIDVARVPASLRLVPCWRQWVDHRLHPWDWSLRPSTVGTEDAHMALVQHALDINACTCSSGCSAV